ncbi:histidine phosphatase family protein [Novosphingobium aquimarinum]|uniref:histidine phosphatase family protein n=1 Tax=Novosphingobium aquimarinum TaxID=2682494 RepID=UPI0012EBFBD9|nr:histidine phosphatase family protein [Novosphingobium aquimarinum]
MTGFPLHFLRHGAPAGAGTLIGHSDADPTEAGIGACLERARMLAVDHVVASDLARAERPARRIAQAIAAPLSTDARWRELDFGAWDGADPDVLAPEAIAAFWNDPDEHAPPGGESWSQLCARVEGALADIAAPTLVVAHAGSIRAALASLVGFDHRQSWTIALPYASLLTLRIWDEGPSRSAQITGLAG